MLILKGSDETAAAWNMFVNEIKKIRDDHVSETIHFVPDVTDMNATSRHDTYRGIAICLDVLANSFENPLELLHTMEAGEKEVRAGSTRDPF
jgi:hypothetical protein